jgi:hypothetical protein
MDAASDPSFTPLPRAFRSSSMPAASARGAHKSPFSALLMPPLDPLPAFPPATKAEPRAETEDEARFAPTELVALPALNERQSALETPLSASEPPALADGEAPRSSQAPRSTRLPPPLPTFAQVPSVPALVMEPVPSTKSTFTTVVAALPVIVDEDVIDAATMFRRAPGRKLWTVLAISSVSVALAVAASTHGSTPSSAAAVTIASAQPAKPPTLNAAAAHAPATPPAVPASSAQVAGNNAPVKSGEVREHSATHAAAAAAKSTSVGKPHPGEKDYGI